jgi:alpha-N-arabinofuranosidase
VTVIAEPIIKARANNVPTRPTPPASGVAFTPFPADDRRRRSQGMLSSAAPKRPWRRSPLARGATPEVHMPSRLAPRLVRSFGALSALFLIEAAGLPAAQPATRQPATVVVDVTATGEPISKYVYGQFIEHLGRCIYGGLWAEMLEDRKFFYPVTGEAPAWETITPGPRSWDGDGKPYEILVRSPWLVIGDPTAVAMVKDGAYVGEHSPRVTLPGGGKPAGLLQERLGLQDGRDYVGRIVLAADAGAGPIDVTLAWGGGAGDRQSVTVTPAAGGFSTHALRFRAGGTTDNGRLEIAGRGTGAFTIGAVSLMPADNVYGWRADTLARLRELDSPVYRWPGGNFVSGYDWRDGTGDPDKRPPRKNPAWKGVEHNDVGLAEFIALCREIGAEPYVAVNTGLGGVAAAADLVQYANGGPDTPMGRLRAQNGHARPFDVRLWAVGNEMYGDWQLGHMPLDEYIEKHKAIVDAMRKADPSSKFVGVGAVGEWSQAMLGRAASHMDLLSEHIYWQDKPTVEAHVAQTVEGIRKIADAHRAYRREVGGLAGRDIRIALDEWNFWYGGNEYGELGTRYFLQDGLGVAAGLHELFRNSDLFWMANYAQTVNVIGAIKTSKTDAEMEATGLVLAAYRRHFGTLPLKVSADAPLEVAAALTPDRGTLTVAVVNPTSEARQLALDLRGANADAQAHQFVLSGQDRWSYNAPGRPRGVTLKQATVGGPLLLEAPPLSVVIRRIPLR